MANKVDIRIVKSKDSLMSALVSLLQKKKLEDLSISEVCQEANVNRNTFYSHYTNIRELFEEMKGQYLESLLSSSKVFLESNDSVNRTLLNVLEKMKAKDKLTKVILSEASSTTFFLISSPTSWLPCNALDTVAMLTPSSSARSFNDTLRLFIFLRL